MNSDRAAERAALYAAAARAGLDIHRLLAQLRSWAESEAKRISPAEAPHVVDQGLYTRDATQLQEVVDHFLGHELHDERLVRYLIATKPLARLLDQNASFLYSTATTGGWVQNFPDAIRVLQQAEASSVEGREYLEKLNTGH